MLKLPVIETFIVIKPDEKHQPGSSNIQIIDKNMLLVKRMENTL